MRQTLPTRKSGGKPTPKVIVREDSDVAVAWWAVACGALIAATVIVVLVALAAARTP